MRGTFALVAGAVLAITLVAARPAAADLVAVVKQGKEAFESRCRLCHSIQTPLAKMKSREEWSQTVKKMVLYGAAVSADERETIVTYLAAQSTFARRCTGCHDPLRVVDAAPGTRSWKALVERMSGHVRELEAKGERKGQPPLSPQEVEEIAALLTLLVP